MKKSPLRAWIRASIAHAHGWRGSAARDFWHAASALSGRPATSEASAARHHFTGFGFPVPAAAHNRSASA